jgi:hypothetical protein
MNVEALSPQAYRYVAICDILGFSALVANSALDELAERFTRLLAAFRDSVHMSSSIFPALGEDSDLVRAVIFSDTVLLYSLPVNPDAAIIDIGIVSCFFDACANLIAVSLIHNMPLRVGIAFGDTYISPADRVYLGQPIVAAYETEQFQDWIGGACHVSCENAPFFERACSEWHNLIRYDVPHHNGYRPMWAVNWAKWTPVVANFTHTHEYLERHSQKKYIEAQRFLSHTRST